MTGASIEAALELWASSLRDVKSRMRGLFTQERVAASATLFLDDLLSDERRKTGWMLAEAAGDPGPWRQQALGRGRWETDELRDIVRDYVVETLATDEAIVAIGEAGFLKQGKASCGVARQYRIGWQDHELPDRCIRGLCIGSRSRVYRSRFVSSKELDG